MQNIDDGGCYAAHNPCSGIIWAILKAAARKIFTPTELSERHSIPQP